MSEQTVFGGTPEGEEVRRLTRAWLEERSEREAVRAALVRVVRNDPNERFVDDLLAAVDAAGLLLVFPTGREHGH